MSGIVLTNDQKKALRKFKQFLDSEDINVFILKGYAGTGKTTLMKKFISHLEKIYTPYTLLASTGRAAKILSNTTDSVATTIHSHIYRFNGLNQSLESIVSEKSAMKNKIKDLVLSFTLFKSDVEDENRVVYIVDEASMISDVKDPLSSQATFGSGKLLTDLFEYSPNGKFVFVGDICQLPPPKESVSPALSSSYIKSNFNYKCIEAELTNIVRQADDVDIVDSAMMMRKLYLEPQTWKWAKFPLRGFKNIHILPTREELIKQYINRVKKSSFNTASLICYSNRQCDGLTEILRPSFNHKVKTLEKGDLLLVTQNNMISGLMNGDMVIVQSILSRVNRAGLTFANVSVKELFTGRVYSQYLIEDILYGNQTNITQPQQRELFIDFYYRMLDKGIKQKDPGFYSIMSNDPYLNAIRAVFGYALTCHKAQGGEWDYVYLDIPRNVPVIEKPYVYQWVYTAMTRAKKEIYIVDDFWVCDEEEAFRYY